MSVSILQIFCFRWQFDLFLICSDNHNQHKFPAAGIGYNNYESSEIQQKIYKEIFINGNNTEKPINYCEVIHIGFVCSGYESNLYLHTLLKSIYFYRHNPIHFHIIVSQVSRKVLGTLFDTWNVPQGCNFQIF